MNPYLGRLLGYLLLSMFIAAAFGPFTGEHLVQQKETHVYLSAVALNAPDQNPACSHQAIPLNQESLQPFPEIMQAVEKFLQAPGDADEISLTHGYLRSFIEKSTGKEQANMCFNYNGGTYRVDLFSIYNKGRIRLVGLNETVPGVTILDESRLEEYPQLSSYINELDSAAEEAQRLGKIENTASQMPSFKKQQDYTSQDVVKAVEQMNPAMGKIDGDEWNRLSRELGATPEAVVFQAGDYLLRGGSMMYDKSVRTAMGWFKYFRYILAAICLVLGIRSMKGIYRRYPGINLNPTWAAKTGDFIFILFLSFCAYCVLEYVLGKFANMLPFLDDPAVIAVSSIGFIPATAFCAFFASNLFGQSIDVGNEGISIYYPGGKEFLAWDDVQAFGLKDTYTVMGRVGAVMPRKLQTKLTIQTGQGPMSLVEPGKRGTKLEVLGALGKYGPERLHADLERLSKEW